MLYTAGGGGARAVSGVQRLCVRTSMYAPPGDPVPDRHRGTDFQDRLVTRVDAGDHATGRST